MAKGSTGARRPARATVDDRAEPTPPSPAQERAIQAIVRSASELFAERGPSAVSLRDVAARAGVNYGLIHHYVGTKEDLIRLVFARLSRQAARRFADTENPDDALDDLLRPGRAAAPYARMLAWALLEGRDPNTLLGRSPALTELIRHIDESAVEGAESRIVVAAAVALSLGWGLYGEFIAAAAGLDDRSPDDMGREISALVHRLVRLRTTA